MMVQICTSFSSAAKLNLKFDGIVHLISESKYEMLGKCRREETPGNQPNANNTQYECYQFKAMLNYC